VQYYDGAAWANLGSVTNVEAFTASGTFTPPAGVTYAIAHIRAGGGGVGASSGAGGNSSVAFAGGTITATGGGNVNQGCTVLNQSGVANSGNGGTAQYSDAAISVVRIGGNGAYIVAGGAVTRRRRHHRYRWRRWHHRHKWCGWRFSAMYGLSTKYE
jgi:hypothetical protein